MENEKEIAKVVNSITVGKPSDEQTKEFLTTLIDSKSLPPHVKNWQTAFTIIQFGQEFGFGPMQSIHQIISINGVLSLKASASAGLVRRAGIKYRTIRDYEYLYPDGTYSYHLLPDVKPINRITEIEFTKEDGETELVRFTYDDAKKAGLLEKDNWLKWPKPLGQ